MWWPVVSFTCGALFAVCALLAMGKLPSGKKGSTVPTGMLPHEMPEPRMTYRDVTNLIATRTADLCEQVSDLQKATRNLSSQVDRAQNMAQVSLSCLHAMKCTLCDMEPVIDPSFVNPDTGKPGINIACKCTRTEGFNVLETVETWNRLQVARREL